MDKVKIIFTVLLGISIAFMGCSKTSSTHPANQTNNSNNDTTTDNHIVIAGIQPANAYANAIITITGTGFGPGSDTVMFDNTIASIQSWSDTSISAVVPDMTAGITKVSISALGHTSNSVDFTVLPFISGTSKSDCVLNDIITIQGTGFGDTQGSGIISYAGTNLPVSSWSAHQINAVIGNISHVSTGQANVFINNAASNGVTLTVHPSINSLTPDTLERGDVVTINGNLFGSTQGTSTITLSGITAAALSWSDTVIKTVVHDRAIKGDAVVSVSNILSAGYGFTVTKAFYSINQPTGLAMDKNENIYVANYTDGTIIQVLPGGITQTTIYKGLSKPMGLYYNSPSILYVACEGDGTIQKITLGATVTAYTYASGFSQPTGITYDNAGNMYVANYGSGIISKIDLNGTISVFSIGVSHPYGLSFVYPYLYVTDPLTDKIYKIDNTGYAIPYLNIQSPYGIVSNGNAEIIFAVDTALSDGLFVQRVNTTYEHPYVTGDAFGIIHARAIAISNNSIYVSSMNNNNIYKVSPQFTPVLKGSNASLYLYSCDWGVAPSINLYQLNDLFSPENGVLSQLYAWDYACYPNSYYGGELITSNAVTDFAFQPFQMAFDITGNTYITRWDNAPQIYKKANSGIIITFATLSCNGSGYTCAPGGIVYDNTNKELYVNSVTSSTIGVIGDIYRLTTDINDNGVLTSLAHNAGIAGKITICTDHRLYGLNSIIGTSINWYDLSNNAAGFYVAGFNNVFDLKCDSNGTIYALDIGTHTLYAVPQYNIKQPIASSVTGSVVGISPAGVIYLGHTWWTCSNACSAGYDIYRIEQQVSEYTHQFISDPRGLARSPSGNIYFADATNNAIYRVDDTTNSISLFATNITSPTWFVFDNSVNIFLSDLSNGRILKYANNNLTTFASGFSGPTGIVFDPLNYLFYVANYFNNTVSTVTASGLVSTFALGLSGPMGLSFISPGNIYASNSTYGKIAKVVQGSGVSILASGFGMPIGITLDNQSIVYVADQLAGMIFTVSPTGGVTPFAHVNSPYGIAFDGQGNLFVSNNRDKQIKKLILH
ncbi:MAG: IPT/TIG domain-containing protein [Deltaproteobacteria bacterium]|nr:IPT/TIG domain-containing protein [Deltaproteobacteria bacterium]MCL5791585.1 IPT/TIG domain-containing protein [Deltaproteobacteria bacterium]